MAKTNNKTWVVGHGDIGHRVAKLYRDRLNESLKVTFHNETALQQEKHAQQTGQQAYYLELDDEQASLPEEITSKIFYFAPPPKTGKQDTRLAGFLNKLAQQPIQPEHIVLISTTGVYGNCNGQWVDESAAINPVAERACRRADAEKALTQWAKQHRKCATILRVPGIYAEDRLPLERLKKGLPIVKESESPWTNRIHADDLANICYQAMLRHSTQSTVEAISKPVEIYNVSDGNPSTMTAYFNAVADYSGLPRPPQISLKQAEAELSAGMMSYMKESRRISNKKMLDQLGVQLLYPMLSHCLKKNS